MVREKTAGLSTRIGTGLGAFVWLCALLPLAGGCGGMSKATGAALNVALATTVGAARVASGNCFTWCDPHHVCNPRTGLCEPLPECSKCGRNQVCKKVGGVGMCVDAATEQYNVRQQMTDPSQPPVGVEPPAGPGPLYQPGPLPE